MAYSSPEKIDRSYARRVHQDARLTFIECHIATSMEICESRDVKGVYAKAKAGIIKNFVGISALYE